MLSADYVALVRILDQLQLERYQKQRELDEIQGRIDVILKRVEKEPIEQPHEDN